MGGPLPLALALSAVVALVALTHLLGFTRERRLESCEQAAGLAQCLHGGFSPIGIILAQDGRGALLRDREGRVAVIAPVGAHFLARILKPGVQVKRMADGRVDLRGLDFAATLDLRQDADHWFSVLTAGPGARS